MAVAATLAVLAIVTQNQASLRAAPRDSAAHQAVLWQGDALEIRGQRMDYLQVYDHRRERAGYIKTSQVRTTALSPLDAPELLSVVRFLRDTAGAEALGISYAAAYLRAVPAQAMSPEAFDAIGTMADRLARRASPPLAKGNETTLSAHLEAVAQHGVAMKTFEREGGMQICYEGEMFRRLLAMPSADADQRARAALGLTRHECANPDLAPQARLALDQWRAEVLDQVPANGVTATLNNRVHLRRSGVWAALAFAQARQAQGPLSQATAQRALQALAAVNKAELTDDDQVEYNNTAVRVGAVRWAAEPAVVSPGKLSIATSAGAPGETCVTLQNSQAAPLAKRCTYGLVWTASARSNASGNALALAVQPLATWRELWVFRQTAQGWVIDVMPPATSSPALGYLEFAGWVPGTNQLLVAREARMEGRFVHRFEVLRLDTLSADKQASSPDLLQAFSRWQDPAWKRGTVALR